jgi:eukaryotic-like serine/threonine-protein kinase
MAKAIASPGEILDGFTVIEPLHKGGMATLWRVTHPDHARPLIMKLPLILDGDEAGMIVSFEAEQMIMPRLSGRHVPAFIASNGIAERPYIVMEYVAAQSVAALVEKAPLPADEVAQIGSAAATALHDLHRQHVLHLDIKPGNILIRPGGAAVLIDFGLSRHDHLPDILAEETRLPIGTGAYIAPEQVAGVRSDTRSDIFALGVVLYQLATGVLPFGNPPGGKALRKRLWRDAIPPRALNPTTPHWLQEIILRCLEVMPEDRYPTAAQLAAALRYPERVVLTARAERRHADGWLAVLKRRFKAGKLRFKTPERVGSRLQDAPLVVAAIDLSESQHELAAALQFTVGRILQISPLARLVCLNVFKTSRLGIDHMLDASGNSIHLHRLIELKDWSQPLGLPEERLSFHVLEAPDPAAAIVHFARLNQADHVVMGARAASPFRRYLGSISAHVVAEAPCSVTIIRLPERVEGEEERS